MNISAQVISERIAALKKKKAALDDRKAEISQKMHELNSKSRELKHRNGKIHSDKCPRCGAKIIQIKFGKGIKKFINDNPDLKSKYEEIDARLYFCSRTVRLKTIYGFEWYYPGECFRRIGGPDFFFDVGPNRSVHEILSVLSGGVDVNYYKHEKSPDWLRSKFEQLHAMYSA